MCPGSTLFAGTERNGVYRSTDNGVTWVPVNSGLVNLRIRNLFSKDSALQVWHTDPLICPKCQHPLRVIAVIDQRAVIEKILRHLGLWSGTPPLAPARSPPVAGARPWTRELFDDVDPMPDYENILTDWPRPGHRAKHARCSPPVGCALPPPPPAGSGSESLPSEPFGRESGGGCLGLTKN
jgi:hypothetical protein